MFESRGQSRTFVLAIVRRFGLCRRPVPDRLEDSSVAEPIHPVERCELHRLQASPRAAGLNHLGPVQPDDGLGQGVAIRIANAPNGLIDSGLGQALFATDGEMLGPSILWRTRASRGSTTRSYSACSSASSAKSVRSEFDTRQPTMRRA